MKRTSSQNVVFNGPSPNDDPFEPPGRSIVSSILRLLRAEGFAADGLSLKNARLIGLSS